MATKTKPMPSTKPKVKVTSKPSTKVSTAKAKAKQPPEPKSNSAQMGKLRRKQIIGVLRAAAKDRKPCPSQLEIGNQLGISDATVSYYVGRMKAEGLLLQATPHRGLSVAPGVRTR